MIELMNGNGGSMRNQFNRFQRQQGLTFFGLIFSLVVLGLIAVLAMKVAPTFIEFQSIKKAIFSVKANANSVRDIQIAFDKQADVGYIESIKATDLIITRNGEEFDVAVEYDKKINLFGPVSLLIEYSATTAKTGVVAKRTP